MKVPYLIPDLGKADRLLKPDDINELIRRMHENTYIATDQIKLEI